MARVGRTRLGETEDVVDEEQDVAGTAFVIAVAEGFRQRQAGEGNGASRSRRFVHLAEHHGHLRLLQGGMVHLAQVPMPLLHGFEEFVAVLYDSGLDHLAEQVVTLAGTLADSGEDRESVMSLGYIVDKLLDEHGLADAGAPEKTDLAALEIGFEQVDDLDSGIKHLLGGREVGEFGRLAVNREGAVGLEGAEAVDRVARDIHDPAPDLGAHRHGDRRAGGRDFQSPAEAVR